MFEVKT